MVEHGGLPRRSRHHVAPRRDTAARGNVPGASLEERRKDFFYRAVEEESGGGTTTLRCISGPRREVCKAVSVVRGGRSVIFQRLESTIVLLESAARIFYQLKNTIETSLSTTRAEFEENPNAFTCSGVTKTRGIRARIREVVIVPFSVCCIRARTIRLCIRTTRVTMKRQFDCSLHADNVVRHERTIPFFSARGQHD